MVVWCDSIQLIFLTAGPGWLLSNWSSVITRQTWLTAVRWRWTGWRTRGRRWRQWRWRCRRCRRSRRLVSECRGPGRGERDHWRVLSVPRWLRECQDPARGPPGDREQRTQYDPPEVHLSGVSQYPDQSGQHHQAQNFNSIRYQARSTDSLLSENLYLQNIFTANKLGLNKTSCLLFTFFSYKGKIN